MADDAFFGEELLRRLEENAPPRIPDEALGSNCPELYEVYGWHKMYAARVVAGLLTLPELQVHGVRLDWLQRLVLSKAKGKRKVRRNDLVRVLNVGMVNARIARLEDPVEDLFCELLVSGLGSFRIFTGLWEDAVAHTGTVIEAFMLLPEHARKRDALSSVLPLLALSDLIADRAGVQPQPPIEGEVSGPVSLPSDVELRKVADRLRFSDHDLRAEKIEPDLLTPFVMAEELLPFVSDRPVGETPLEFYPLLRVANGFVVASPGSLSIAVRALLISVAKDGGFIQQFETELMRSQERHTEIGHFWPSRSIRLSPPNNFGMRASVVAYDEGRLLHVVQLPPLTDNFPQRGFGVVRELSPQAQAFLTSDIERFWSYGLARPDCRAMSTIILLSGWGGTYGLAATFEERNAPSHWQYIVMSYADIGTLATIQDGGFRDFSRIVEQQRRLERDGFHFRNLSGPLNLFGFWQMTDGNLIPAHFLDVQPPFYVGMPTDALLKPRLQAVLSRDVRKLPMPDGVLKVVERLDRSGNDELRPVYVSPVDLDRGVLLGAVFLRDRAWWVESSARGEENREWRYRLWHAVLEWLDAVAEPIAARYPDYFARPSVLISLIIPEGKLLEKIENNRTQEPALPDTITVERSASGATITIEKAWLTYLHYPRNDAEVELTSAVLGAVSLRNDGALDRNPIRDQVRAAVGSDDWRQIHAREVSRPEARLAASGLVRSFEPIPFSAHTLVKCDSIWTFRDRAEGNEIDGIDNCKRFILQYCDAMLEALLSDIRRFNRLRLCLKCGERYQSARVEMQNWHFSIRALRAIRGDNADAAAFEQFSASNAVQRGAKIIAEIAACEAPLESGYSPSVAEVDELFATVLLIFGNSHLFHSIEYELIPARIRISPAGDLLSDRSMTLDVVRPVAEWQNTRMLNEAARAYVERKAADTVSKDELDTELRAALEAEYGAPPEAFANLQFAAIDFATSKGAGVVAVRRSELAAWLVEGGYGSASDILLFLKRFTLPARQGWKNLRTSLKPSDIDFTRFDRPWSLINRALLALDQEDDPTVLVVPMMISDATMYCISGLMDGALNNEFWVSAEARRFAGTKGKLSGDQFEDLLANKLRGLDLEVIPRCKLSAVLNMKVPPELGDIDALVISQDRKRVWCLEAKNLRLCRTEAEAAARMSEYRGRMTTKRGKSEPDKMLRHLRRVEFLRAHRDRLSQRLTGVSTPDVHGRLVVNAPQPMNFKTLEVSPDACSVHFDALDKNSF